jgi:hypothetical protein
MDGSGWVDRPPTRANNRPPSRSAHMIATAPSPGNRITIVDICFFAPEVADVLRRRNRRVRINGSSKQKKPDGATPIEL